MKKTSVLLFVLVVSSVSSEFLTEKLVYPGEPLSPYLHRPYFHYRFLHPEYYSSPFRFNVRRLGLPLASVPSTPFIPPPLIFANSDRAEQDSRSYGIDARSGFNRGPLEVIVDYSSVKNTTRPAYSSIHYSVGCGIQNSENPFKKISPGSENGRIIGGSNANPGEFPWQVSLQQKSRRGNQHICGGTVVSENIIISASHCVHGSRPSDLLIVAGAHSLDSFTGNEQVRSVKYILERGYNQKTFERDIALLVLDKPLKFDRLHVAPVCLPNAGFNYNGVDGIITGWGRLSEAGNRADALQVVSVPFVTREKCRKSYQAVGYGNNVGKCHICSGSDEGGVDSCQGDSGGPLTCVESDGRHYLCGIVSWGIGCARPDYPGVYTFTPCYSNWIAEQISTHNSSRAV